MIELASEINTEMPDYVVQKVSDAVNDFGIALSRTKVLVLGVAYKKNIDDLRESPALEIIHQLQQKGAFVSYHDPYCAEIADDGHTPITGLPMQSAPLTKERLAETDLVLIATDHSDVDYQLVADSVKLVVDTRGAMRKITGRAKIVGLSGTHREPVKGNQAERVGA
jgi:UDP-N-acetyl-D-glucosamine dehydrogenase